MISKLIKILGVGIIRSFDMLVAMGTANKIVLKEEEFPFYHILKKNHTLLLEEHKKNSPKMQSIKDFFRGEQYLVDDDNWQAVPIVLFDYLFRENSQKYPITFKLASELPGCRGIMISVLGPNKTIPLHKGIYKGIYRCLYTLEVEDGNSCWINIDGNKFYFKESESIVFDETAYHEVVNNSSKPRIVLFLDFYRNLPFPLNTLNDIIFSLLRKSPFVMNILGKYKKLEDCHIDTFNPLPSTLKL